MRAYVPLDPTYPADRLAHMLDDSAPVAVLTQAALRDRLPGAAKALPVLVLDDAAEMALLAALDDSNPDPAALGVTPSHLAYVIYTSGSTGLPKGVMIEHAGVVNRLLWMQDAFALGADDVVLQKTPFSFDVSVWEFFWPLQVGASLVIARPDGHEQPDYLARLIEDSGVTTLHFVPTHAASLRRTVRPLARRAAQARVLQRRGAAGALARALPLDLAGHRPAQPVRPDRGGGGRHLARLQ